MDFVKTGFDSSSYFKLHYFHPKIILHYYCCLNVELPCFSYHKFSICTLFRRIMFGTTQLYVYLDSEEKTRGKKYPEITYEMAQEEIAAKAGINITDETSRGKWL